MSNKSTEIKVDGIPKNVQEPTAALCRSRLIMAVRELLNESDVEEVRITVGTVAESKETEKAESDYELSVEKRAQRYIPQQPLYTFDQLIVSEEVKQSLLLAITLIQLEHKIFDEWGLRKIEPFPRTALNFHGLSGTGKTLAAHAIASHIQRPIIAISYADVESMYHGEGPKNVEAIFFAAKKENALLFIDEADSLLSKRLTNVTQGSEQAINSMRSQLLISLEKFQGIVIFATNLVSNYDKAFETRVRNIHFPMPDEESRRKIWERHLPAQLPLSEVSTGELAKIEDICGRDIKNAVIDAATLVAQSGGESIKFKDLVDSVERIKASRIALNPIQGNELSEKEKELVEKKVKDSLAKNQNE